MALFSGFINAEEVNFNCKNIKHLVYYYDDNGNFKRTLEGPLERNRTYSFNTDKKILVDNYGGEGHYKETELYLEWVEIIEEDNYVNYKLNRITGVLTLSHYYYLSTHPNKDIPLQHFYTFNCKKSQKLL